MSLIVENAFFFFFQNTDLLLELSLYISFRGEPIVSQNSPIFFSNITFIHRALVNKVWVEEMQWIR